MTKNEAWGAIAWMLAAIITAFVLLFMFLTLAMAQENPLDCVKNAPASAHFCKPGDQAGGGKIKIENRVRAGTITGEGSYSRCEVQLVWVDGGVCNYCRTKEQCGST